MTTNNHLNNFIKLDSKILEEHLKTVEELLEVKNLDLDNTKYLADILFCLERYDESIEQLKKILSLKSDDSEIITNIGINYFKNKDYETSIKYFTRSLEKNPGNETALSYKMLSHEFLKDYRSAVECCDEILKNNSRNTSVINRLIDYHYELKNYDDCLDYINQIKYEDKYKKALVLYKLKRYEECIKTTGEIRTAKSYHLAGKSYYKLGNIVKAVKYLNKSYEIDFNIDSLFEIIDIYFEAKEYQKSIIFLKKVLIDDDLNIKANKKIAFAYLESGNWYEAIEYSEKTLEISTKLPEVYITLAEAQFQLEPDNLEKINQILDEGIKENPDSAKLWAEKGGYNFIYNPDTFRQSYEKALSLNPNNITIYKSYIYLLLLDEDDESAKKIYNQMLFYNPLFEENFHDFKSSIIT